MEFPKQVKVVVYLTTNERERETVFAPEEHESHAEFAARVWDQLTDLLEIVNR